MPQTRSGAKTSADKTKPTVAKTNGKGTAKKDVASTKRLDAKKTQNSVAQVEVHDETAASANNDSAPSEANSTSNPTEESSSTISRKTKKRSSRSNDDQAPAAKKSKSGSASKDAHDKAADKGPNEDERETRPRLRTPDIEFDFDRTQLRDPRPTPGRKRRYRYDELELKLHYPELKAHFETNFHIRKPAAPKKRLNAFEKDGQYGKEARMNPLMTFHDEEKLLKKGSHGTPTYDTAGFQLDYDKVNGTRSQTYSKKSVVNGMNRRLEKMASEREKIYRSFFDPEGGVPAEDGRSTVLDYVKDHISKDLGVPWHQVDSTTAAFWEGRRVSGNTPKVSYDTWWTEPNEVEKRRMDKLHEGCIYRKTLKLNLK